MKINEKIKLIRETEKITQANFATLIGLSSDSRVRDVETGKIKNVGSDKIEKICKKFPEYTLWLLTGRVDPPHQISPEQKQHAKEQKQLQQEIKELKALTKAKLNKLQQGQKDTLSPS